MARASNAKKFSLVYHELGRDDRRGRDWTVVTEDPLEDAALSDSGEAETLLADEPASDIFRSTGV